MSEQNPFGPHIMDAYVNLGNAWTYLDEARPASTLWFNNHGGAQECKRRYPWMHVVHRQVNDNQQKWHEVTTPEQWYAEHKVFGANGVIIQCYNEPGGDFRNNAAYRNAVIDFMLGVWRLGARDGVAIGGPTFPTGNPHESRIVDGSFDRMIIEACGNPFAWMFFHEYWHTDPVAEYPWMVGRHEFWYDRADTIGLNLARVLLTEYGMDKGGGVDDGYRNQGVSPEEYAQQHIRSRTVLERKPPVNIFAFGIGWGWWSFDMDYKGFKDGVKGYREPTEEKPPVSYDFVDGVVTAVGQQWANVRSDSSTSAPIVGRVGLGDPVRVDLGGGLAVGSNYVWFVAEWNGKVAYIAHMNSVTGYIVCDIALADDNLPAVMLDVPYVSQSGDDANIRQNDCGIACALMVYQFALQEAGFKPNTTMTVDSLIEKSPLAGNDNPVGITQLTAFCNALGIEARYQRPLDGDGIVRLIDQGVAPILLVRYKYIYPDTFTGGHYVVAVGYNEDGVFVHDPYRGGEAHFVSFPDLILAMTDMGEAAALDYQGIVAGHPSKMLALHIDG